MARYYVAFYFGDEPPPGSPSFDWFADSGRILANTPEEAVAKLSTLDWWERPGAEFFPTGAVPTPRAIRPGDAVMNGKRWVLTDNGLKEF